MNDETTNPYLAARIQWNAHVGAALSAARTWQIIAISSLAIAFVAVGVIFRRRLHQSARFEACCAYGS
jgi:type IV secretory pathway TrbF-like protein